MMTAIDRRKYMDQDEVRQIRTVAEAGAITDLRHGRRQGVTAWMLVDMALQTGLRVSELAAVQVEDIDAGRCALTVRRVKRRQSREETLAISTGLLKHLQEYIAWAELNSGPLFIGQRGPMTRRALQQIWKKVAKLVGLPDTSIHSARHTMAVHLLKKTGNLRQVQKQLGHASPTTTANMYADISFADMQNGVEGLYDEDGPHVDDVPTKLE